MNFWYFDFNDSTIPQRTRDEHLSLIEALTLRDTEKAKRILGEHLDNSKKATLDFLFTHH
jgi:DNA-binding GntR family transcriptional regulator